MPTEPASTVAESSPDMSAGMMAKVRQMVPPLLEQFHKGQLGRVAVIGGSVDYTGAPYFSAMASARLGADMSHVICEPHAAAVIKTYSPNLMVHPLMRQSQPQSTTPTSPTPSASEIADTVIDMLPRLHSLVVGPGLGRDPLMQETCALVLAEARKRNIPFVLDADALALAQTNPDLIRGYPECILTPNVVEFGRLAKALGIDDEAGTQAPEENDTNNRCAKLSRALGGVLVLQKGRVDILSNGRRTVTCDLPGGRKRCGGQGDTLTGSLATFLAWRKAYLDRIWEVPAPTMNAEELLMVAAYGGAAITRECSRQAFEKLGRSVQASDLTDVVAVAFRTLVGDVDGDGSGDGGNGGEKKGKGD